MSDNENKVVPAKQELQKKQESQKKNAKTRSNKEQKPNIFVRFWKKMKEVFSELKKVTWPSFAKTVKQTGVVIGVTLFFIVVIGGFNALFLYLYTLMTGIPFTSFF